MRHKDEQSCGSFTTWGTGFNYDYDSSLKKLEVFRARTGSALIQLDFDDCLSNSPRDFVSILEKSTQIKALGLTNNTSIDLSETFDDLKLRPMMTETVRLARYAFDLMQNNFDRFESYFCTDTSLKQMKIKKIGKSGASKSFYTARLETRHNSNVTVESPTLHNAMSILSQKIVQDLITREFVSRFDELAFSLLGTSSKVTILSMILNEKFYPEYKIKKPTSLREQTRSLIIL